MMEVLVDFSKGSVHRMTKTWVRCVEERKWQVKEGDPVKSYR